MRDYEEKSFYEIQLDNKQLILVFLAGVTVCVLIFVLGVMVGKGKKEAEMAATNKVETPTAQKAPQEDTEPPAEAKPIVENKTSPVKKTAQNDAKTKPGEDYSFYDLDKDKPGTESKVAKKEEPKAAATDSKAAPKEKNEPEQKPKPDQTTKPEQTSKPVSNEPPPAPVTTAAAAANPSSDNTETSVPSGTGRYTVQVMATASKSKADQQVADLQAKGYPVFLSEEKSGKGSVYKVRVGRYSDSDSAKKIATKLKQEMNLETWVAVLD
jgi:DedD protein